jgi:hypothetical protein
MAERFDRNRAAIAAALCIAVIVLALATQIVPWLTMQRDVVSSTPIRNELTFLQPIVLHAGQRGCLDDVTLDPSTQVARLTIGRAPLSGGRLSIETAGPGYRATVTARTSQSGQLDIPFSPPRRGVVGTLCARNAGRGTIELAGTADSRALTRSSIAIDGVQHPEAFSLTLLETGRRSYLDRVPQLVDRVTALSALGPWFLWLLVPLLVVGVPAGVIAALYLALREPDPPLSP